MNYIKSNLFKAKNKNRITRFFLRIYRNCFVLGDVRRPVYPFTVNLLYWKPSNGVENVGDALSKIIYSEMCKYYRLGKLTSRTYKLSCVGSVLNFISCDCVVWGSGFLSEDLANYVDGKEMHWDIRAVRGPRTRCVLLDKGYDCPSVYGDPVILLPLFYKPDVLTFKDKVVIIPHYSKFEEYNLKYKNVLCTKTNDWKNFVGEVCSASFVISASLHGIIIAESYGVPAVFLNDVEHDLFKYEDYYYSTGRRVFKIAKSVDDAMKIGAEALPDFSNIRMSLLSSFPVDLWKNEK